MPADTSRTDTSRTDTSRTTNVTSQADIVGDEADLFDAIESLPGTVVAGHRVLDVMFCGQTRDLWTTELRQAIAEVEDLIVSLRASGNTEEADALVQMLAKMNQALEIEQQRVTRIRRSLSCPKLDPKLQGVFTSLVQLRISATETHPGCAEHLEAVQGVEADLPECVQGWELHEIALHLEHTAQQLTGAGFEDVAGELCAIATEMAAVADKQAFEDEASFYRAGFEAADANRDGSISRTEFAKAREKEASHTLPGATAWYSGEPSEALAQAVCLCQLVLVALSNRNNPGSPLALEGDDSAS
eukprot:TRINITY_DN5287_c0_g1_i1.p1 TRINITY_DN5287_c0_g1~~TRINITY_DN5287_c0_g1_i1.p1  ORF type:complete len:302 (+),score=68.21 TRINITY_DN5287_c0_g1_i1:252-1157(+)